MGKLMGLYLLNVFAASTFHGSKQEMGSEGDGKRNCGWTEKFIPK